MRTAQIRTEILTIPSYPIPPKEELPFFAENRVHQRSSGRPYPNRAAVELDHSHTEPRDYTAVHLENDFLDVLILPEIGGRIFAARDKTTGYDFFYRQPDPHPFSRQYALLGVFPERQTEILQYHH